MKLFVRNSPFVIKAATELSEADFVAKYLDVTSKDVLTIAYKEIRKKAGIDSVPIVAPVENKSVTFKVMQKKPVVKPVMTVVKDEPVVVDEAPTIENIISERREMVAQYDKAIDEILDEPELSHDQQIEEDMLSAANSVEINNLYGEKDEVASDVEMEEDKVDPVAKRISDFNASINKEKLLSGKKSRKPRTTERGEARDARILELLEEKKSTLDIIKQMADEGFKVHAPQISIIRALIGK